MARTPLLLAALLPAFGCAQAPTQPSAVLPVGQSCGIQLVDSLRPPRPGSARTRLRSGDALRACELPGAEGIELACESVEAVPIPGSHSPDDPDAPDYRYPAYAVTNAQCAYTDDTASRARCTFDFAVGDAAPRRTSAELVYRFATSAIRSRTIIGPRCGRWMRPVGRSECDWRSRGSSHE